MPAPKLLQNQNKTSQSAKKNQLRYPPIVFPKTQHEIARLSKILNCPILVYFKPSNSSIWSKDVHAINECLKHIGKTERLALYVRSDGGAGMISLRIINLLRHFTKELIILAPSECASAATMLALGCDEIHLGPLSSLSAVDSSLVHPLSPHDKNGNQVSVSQDELWRVLRLWKEVYHDEDHYGFYHREDSLSTSELDMNPDVDKKNTKADTGPKAFTRGDTEQQAREIKIGFEKNTQKSQFFSGSENPYKYLFEFIHPLVFGAIDRSSSLSVRLCREILSYHIKDEKKIDEISRSLTYNYPAHGYPITMRGAEKLGLNIKPITDSCHHILNNLQILYSELTDNIVTDYDRESYHNSSVMTVVETLDKKIFYQYDYDKFYHEHEKRYLTLNDNSGWYATTWDADSESRSKKNIVRTKIFL